MGTVTGAPSLHRLACQYLKEKYHKPGNVYLGVVMRLDALATGVVIFGRTSKAAARLSAQFRDRRVEKCYGAIVEGQLPSPGGELVDWVSKDEARRRMEVSAADVPGAQQARLSYTPLQHLEAGTFVSVALDTGRKHQIRLQFSTRGWPILGDLKYGARTAFAAGGIALHAATLSLEHPVSHESMAFRAPLPSSWKRLGVDSELLNDRPLR